jgi:hypothetical protein
MADNLKERPQGRLDGDGWIILNWMLEKWDGEGVWYGFIWFRIGARAGPCELRFHKMLEIS